jgi:DNA repair exonuclease SbcCD ATPase subunit
MLEAPIQQNSPEAAPSPTPTMMFSTPVQPSAPPSQSNNFPPEQVVCDRVKRSLGTIYNHLMGVVEHERKLVTETEACEREQKTLQEQTEALSQKEQQIAELEAKLVQRTQVLDRREAQIRAKGEELERIKTEVNQLRNNFQVRMRALEDCERVIAQFEQTFGKLVNAPEMRLSDAVDELKRFIERHAV